MTLWRQYQEDAAAFFRALGMEVTCSPKVEPVET